MRHRGVCMSLSFFMWFRKQMFRGATGLKQMLVYVIKVLT